MSKIFGSTGAGIIITFLFILVLVLIVTAIHLSGKIGRLERKYRSFMKGTDGQSVEKAILERMKDIDKLLAHDEKAREELRKLKKQSRKTLKKFGVVKYDAFEDVGGKLSFALAMLDDDNSGFVLDAIHSRDNCFVYLKEVVKGESYIMLSEEELQALKDAAAVNEEEPL